MTRSLRLSLLVALTLLMTSLLAACGSTALVTDVPVMTLPSGMQVFTMTDQLNGTLSVVAPVGTFSKSDPESGSLVLGTTEASLSATNTSNFTAGQWGLSLGALPLNVAQAIVSSNQTQTLTPQVLVDAFKAQTIANIPQTTFGSSSTTIVGGNNAARATGTSPQGDILLIAVDLGGSYLLASGVTAKGDLSKQDAILTQIVSSATYTTTK